jgi:hypothetical protein
MNYLKQERATLEKQVIESAGEEAYFALREVWAELLAYFSEGKLAHCGIIARKK